MNTEFTMLKRLLRRIRAPLRKAPFCVVVRSLYVLSKDTGPTQVMLEKIAEVKVDVEGVSEKMETQSKVHSTLVPRWMFLSAFGLMLMAGDGGSSHLATP